MDGTTESATRLSCNSLPRCFFSSRRRHTSSPRDWSSDVCSSDLLEVERNLVDLSVSADGDPAALENRLVQWTLDASLVDAVDVGEGKRPLRYLTERVKVPI